MSEGTTTPARLALNGKELELPRVAATEGNDGITVSKLLSETGVVTLDPGFTNTASCASDITYIDGGAGILRYRGYPIEQLATQTSFLEVSYLLLYGELPSASELTAFDDRVNRHTLIREDFARIFDAFPRDAHPMSVVASATAALGGFYPDALDIESDEVAELTTVRLLAKMPTIVARVFKKMQGASPLYPDNDYGYVDDFLRMTFGNPSERYEVDPVVSKALDALLILHADHEQNCSTSSVRLVGSSQATLYASISAGIGALSGPLHGGANEAVLQMLEDIRSTGDSVERYVDRVKNKESGVRLMGFGHRVYKNYDPRAAIVKQAADEILQSLGARDELFDIAQNLEEIALKDDYFIERKLYPNVDFYTGLIYKAMGFPNEMFTPLFVMGRLPGWIAQWHEMRKDPATKIGRPRQVYTGPGERDVEAIADR